MAKWFQKVAGAPIALSPEIPGAVLSDSGKTPVKGFFKLLDDKKRQSQCGVYHKCEQTGCAVNLCDLALIPYVGPKFKAALIRGGCASIELLARKLAVADDPVAELRAMLRNPNAGKRMPNYKGDGEPPVVAEYNTRTCSSVIEALQAIAEGSFEQYTSSKAKLLKGGVFGREAQEHYARIRPLCLVISDAVATRPATPVLDDLGEIEDELFHKPPHSPPPPPVSPTGAMIDGNLEDMLREGNLDAALDQLETLSVPSDDDDDGGQAAVLQELEAAAEGL